MFVVNCQIYPFDILVYFGTDFKPLFKELKKYINNTDLSELKQMRFKAGKTVMFSTGQTLLWLKNKPKSISDLATLQHEIFHCANFILNRVGIQLDDNSDEAYAYLIEYLTKQIYKEIGITFS